MAAPHFPCPLARSETHATSSPPHAASGDWHRTRAARAGCSGDNPTALLPGDKEQWGGLEGSAEPTCFHWVPSGDCTPAVSHGAQRLLCVREGASCDSEGWRKEGCFAAPSPALKAGQQAHVPAVGP